MAQAERASVALMRLLRGYQVSQAIHVAAVLGIADHLAAGPRSSDDLALAVGAHPDALYRLLRALAAVGVLSEGQDSAFSLTPLGGLLRADSPEPARDWAVFIGQDYYWETWGNLLKGMRSGENVFPLLHDGQDIWTYRSTKPEASALFDRAMTSLSKMVSQAVLSIYDFSPLSLVVDVGGGRGGLLADILQANPASRGILFDQPHVVSNEHLKNAGVDDRSEVIGGNFFDSVPDGADAYILKAIIHDWADTESIAILKTCRRSMRAGAKLLIIEQIVGPPNEGPRTKFSDLNMLVMPGGRERTEEEFGQLLNASGFRLTRVVSPGPDQVCVIEGVPA
jgi:hypothetical protein